MEGASGRARGQPKHTNKQHSAHKQQIQQFFGFSSSSQELWNCFVCCWLAAELLAPWVGLHSTHLLLRSIHQFISLIAGLPLKEEEEFHSTLILQLHWLISLGACLSFWLVAMPLLRPLTHPKTNPMPKQSTNNAAPRFMLRFQKSSRIAQFFHFFFSSAYAWAPRPQQMKSIQSSH